MPRYDLRCPDCGWEGEVECKISECGSQACRRLAEQETEGMMPTHACSGVLEIVIPLPSSSRTDMRYGAKAILGDGSKIKGAFGRSERKNKLGF